MKPFVLPMLALALFAGGCADLYEVDPAHAARADSSAAGYDVAAGVATAAARPRAGGSAGSEGSTLKPRRSTRAGVAPDSTITVAQSDTMKPPADSVSVTGDSAIANGADTTRPDVATLPDSLVAPPDDSIVVNTFLAYNPAAKTVWIDLVAGFNAANGSLNFNGGFAGSHSVVVPVGWRVEVRFVNRDSELAHSALVIRPVDPIPVVAPPAAFAGAFSLGLEDGLMEGRTDSFRFSADREGRFMILCGVPGHGQGGMWVVLDVKDGTGEPEYRR